MSDEENGGKKVSPFSVHKKPDRKSLSGRVK